MMSVVASPARRPLRRARARETVLLRVLAAGALALLSVYAFGLLYLLVRGGSRIVRFTLFDTPELGIPGEGTARALFAAAFGVSAGAAALWAVRGGASLVERIGASDQVAARLERWVHSRAASAFPLACALVFAVVLRDHLPRFLIAFPSETRPGGGVGPEIFNTIYFAVLSTAVTTPIGIGAALYLARFAQSRWFTSSLRVALDTLASLPSIVYGLFGFLVFVVLMKTGYSLLAGAAVLSILNLPLMVGIAEESIRAVPRELEDASLALGATKVQTALRVSLPYAWPGILGAVVLSIGRVFAESAPLIMTAGTTVSRSNAFSLDPMRGGETLAVHLWYVNSAGLSPDRADVSAGTAAVLVVLVAMTNLLASRLSRLGGTHAGRLRRATRTLPRLTVTTPGAGTSGAGRSRNGVSSSA